jgi:hypothetical protein
MTDDTNTTPAEPVGNPAEAPAAPPALETYAPAPAYYAAPVAAAPAAPPRHHRWPMWLAAAALAVLIFGLGFRVGLGFGARLGIGRGLRAGYAAGAVQQYRGGGRGAPAPGFNY